MPIYVGEEEGEEERVILLLASNGSLDKSPNNTNTKFVNFLAQEIINKDQKQPHLLLRVTRAYIPCGLVPEHHLPKDEANDILQIRIDQVHSQIVNSQREQIAAVFNLRENDPRLLEQNRRNAPIDADDSASSLITSTTDAESAAFPFLNQRNYIIKEFHHSPLLQVSDRILKRLSIHLTQINGDTYPVQANLPPTLIQLQIFSMKMHQPENTVYCVSHLAHDRLNLYPQNTLTDFKSKLPHPIDVSNMEMCLSSISMPALPSPFHLFVRLQLMFHKSYLPPTHPHEDLSRIISVQIEPGMDKKSIVRELCDKIKVDDYLKQKVVVAFEGDDQERNLRFAVQNRIRNFYLSIRWNDLGCVLFGYPHLRKKIFTIPPTDQEEAGIQTRSSSHRRQLIGRLPCAQVDQLFVPDIGLLYCDLLKASPVGDSMGQLLEIIPLSNFIKEKNHRNSVHLYTPTNTHFKALGATKISEIYFRILRADGQPIVFPPVTTDTMTNSGGTIIELKFRPTAKKPQTVKEMDRERHKIDEGETKEAHFFRSDWKRDLLLRNIK